MERPTCTSWLSPRAHDRFASRFTVHYLNGNRIGQGIMTNVSLQGWTVRGQGPVLVGEALVFRLPFDEPDNTLCDTRTIVRWVSGDAFGVEILDQSPTTQARLRTWVRVMTNALEWSRLTCFI